MGKKSKTKTNRAQTELKSLDDRIKSKNEMMSKLAVLGIEGQTPVLELMRIMDTYVENGESVSGKIAFPADNRTIAYIFSSKKRILNSITMKKN